MVETLQVNAKSIALIKNKFAKLYRDDNQKNFPFMNRLMLQELIFSIEEDIEKYALQFFALFRKLRSSSRNVALKPLYETIQLLAFCRDAIPPESCAVFSLYDLVIARILGANALTLEAQRVDETLLLAKSQSVQKIAIDTMVLHFHENLPKEVMPLSVFPHLKMLQRKPITFSALLLWSFERGMPFNQCIESGLFQSLWQQQESPFSFLNEVVKLLSLYRDADSCVSTFLKAANAVSCGSIAYPNHSLLGEACAAPFSKEQMDASSELATLYAKKPLVVIAEHVPYLYKTFGQRYALQLLEQSSDKGSSIARTNIQEVIRYLSMSDFIVFLESINGEQKLVQALQNACRSKFYAFVSGLERLILHDAKQCKGPFSAHFFSRSLQAWQLLSKAATLLGALAWEIQWDYPCQYAYCALLLQKQFEVDGSGVMSERLSMVEGMMSLLRCSLSRDEFLFQVALEARGAIVQQWIVKTCNLTVESQSGNGETFFLRALRAPRKALASEILSSSEPQAIKRLFIGESNHQYSFFRNMANKPGLLHRFLGMLPDKAHWEEITNEDWHGDALLHWLAGSSEAIELIFPLIPTPLQRRLLQRVNHERETFLHKGARNTALLQLAYHHYSKDDLLKKDAGENTVLHRAASSKAALEILLSKFERAEYDALLMEKNQRGQCLLLCAATNPDALKFLLNYYPRHVILDIKDENENTLMHLASVHAESFTYLFHRLRGVDDPLFLHAPNKFGQTVLSLAQRNEKLHELNLNQIGEKAAKKHQVGLNLPRFSLPHLAPKDGDEALPPLRTRYR